jgi:hypothetical protein
VQHHSHIGPAEIESDADYIVYGPTFGVSAECPTLSAAERALHAKLSEANERNMASDLSIFRWSGEKWVVVVDPYAVQNWELERNPSRWIHFP